MSIGSVNVPGSIGAGVKSNPNLFHNSYWAAKEYIINQRGKLEYSGNVQCMDRWKTDSTISYGKLTIEDDGIILEHTANDEGITAITQRCEFLPEGIYSLSVLTADNVLALLTGSFKSEVATFGNLRLNLFPNSGGYKAAQIAVVGQGHRKLLAAKLEPGSTQTLAHKEGDTWVLNDLPPDPALELAKCQRYYRKGILRYRQVPESPTLFDPTADVIPIQMRIGATYTFTNIRNSYNSPLTCTIKNVYVDPLGKSFPTIEMSETDLPSLFAVDYEASSDL